MMAKHQTMTTAAQPSRTHRHAGVLTALLALGGLAAPAAALDVRLGYLGPTGGDAYKGAQQGLAEANTQGKFLGLHYELVPVADAAAAQALKATALVADAPADALPVLADAVPGTAVLNVTATADHLRTRCGTNLFHVIPSEHMLATAVQQWKRQAPESTAVAQAWHPAFEKYAAAQLNKRYTEATGQPMSDPAWAGWAAVKLVSATIAELQTAAPEVLLDTVQSRLAFDGQKGVDMSFRVDGQLRQPLLLVENGALVGEAPVRGVAEAEDLDSLGGATCAK